MCLGAYCGACQVIKRQLEIPAKENRKHALSVLSAIISCFGYTALANPANMPRLNVDNIMSKKAVKSTLTSAEIEAQTAAFLKSGGRVEHVGKGKSGQLTTAGPKQINLKSN